MIVLRNPSEVAGIANPFIRQLLALRFRQLNLGDGPDASGSFIVVEAGDSIDQLEHEAGLPILHGLFDDLPYGHPDFSPCFEILEEHCNGHRNDHYTNDRCTDGNDAVYEMVFISNDDGAFTCLFIADTEGIDANLLALCAAYATPAVTRPDPANDQPDRPSTSRQTPSMPASPVGLGGVSFFMEQPYATNTGNTLCNPHRSAGGRSGQWPRSGPA